MKKILLNPFEKYSENLLFIFGILFTLISSYLAYLFSARLDGALDFHFSGGIELRQPFIDSAINIITLSIFLFIAALLINKKTRIIDILNVALVPRIIYCLLPLLNIGGFIYDPETDSTNLTSLSTLNAAIQIVFAIIMLSMVVWLIALLYNGFKTATNLKTTKHKVIFGVALLMAEILSTYIISILNY